jgi:hypothetical protein
MEERRGVWLRRGVGSWKGSDEIETGMWFRDSMFI